MITVAEADDVLSVPAAAVTTAGNASTVVVEDAAEQTSTKTIQIGVRGESTVEVKSGLNEGDRVVVTAASPGTANSGRTDGFVGTGGFGGTGGNGGQRPAGTGGTGEPP